MTPTRVAETIIFGCLLLLKQSAGTNSFLFWWNYLWNESYIKLRIWRQVGYDRRSYGRHFCHCVERPGYSVTVLTFSGFSMQLHNCVHNCEDHSLFVILIFMAFFNQRENSIFAFLSSVLHVLCAFQDILQEQNLQLTLHQKFMRH